MVAAAIMKIIKIVLSQKWFERFSQNFVRWCRIGLLTIVAIKSSLFLKILCDVADTWNLEN